MCEVLQDEHGLRIVDHHSPLAEVARLYPSVWDLEVRVLSRMFGHTLKRTVNGGHTELLISPAEEQAAPVEKTEAPSAPVRKTVKGTKTSRTASVTKREAPAPPPAPKPELELAVAPSAPAVKIREDLFE